MPDSDLLPVRIAMSGTARAPPWAPLCFSGAAPGRGCWYRDPAGGWSFSHHQPRRPSAHFPAEAARQAPGQRPAPEGCEEEAAARTAGFEGWKVRRLAARVVFADDPAENTPPAASPV